MEEKEFQQKMENLKKPEIVADASRRQFRLTILNARKSAAWGVWFLVIPVLFLVSVTIKEFFGWDWGFANTIEEWIGNMDRNARWTGPVLFILLPKIVLLLNLLAIIHFMYDKVSKEVIVTIKLKWFNIVLVLLSAAILGVVSLYVIMENSAEKAIHRMEQESRQK
jgi:lantibiotic transport system permease protein